MIYKEIDKSNCHYREWQLWIFARDVQAHLALQIFWCNSWNKNKIKITPDEVSFDSFEKDEMNTVRQVLTLIVVAISQYSDEVLLDKKVVELPDNPIVNNIHKSEWWDLFEQFPINAKIYCLYRAYHLLTNKLSDRNTPLFRILYICTCLELWRMQVPPEVIAWPIWKNVHWWDLIIQLSKRFSDGKMFDFTENGYVWFTRFLQEEIENISQTEIPRNVMNHFYAKNWVRVSNEVSMVQSYLDKILISK